MFNISQAEIKRRCEERPGLGELQARREIEGEIIAKRREQRKRTIAPLGRGLWQ